MLQVHPSVLRFDARGETPPTESRGAGQARDDARPWTVRCRPDWGRLAIAAVLAASLPSAASGFGPLRASAANRTESRLLAADQSKGESAPAGAARDAAGQSLAPPDMAETVDPAAKAMFDAAVKAVAQLKSVQLTIDLRDIESQTPTKPRSEMSGTVALQFASTGDGGFPMSRVRLAGGSAEAGYRLAYDGNTVLSVDERAKTFVLADESAGLPKLASDGLMPMWFFSCRIIANSPPDSPAAPKLIAAQLGPEETVGGERCDMLSIARGIDAGSGPMVLQQRIALAQSDRLPRRIESWIRLHGSGRTAPWWLRVETYTAIRVDGAMADDLFSTAAPSGYARSNGASAAPRPDTSAGNPPRRSAEFEQARAEFLRAYADQVADEARVDAELAWLANAGPQLGEAGLEVGSAGQPNPEIERRYRFAEMRFRAAGATEADIREATRSRRDREEMLEPMTPPALGIGDPAPPLEVEAFIKGARVDRFEKGRIYVIQLWASWAAPAVKTIPLMTEIQTKFKEKVTVVGVSLNEPGGIEKVKRFVQSNSARFGYTLAHDGSARKMEKSYMNAAEIPGVPAAFVIDGSGRIAFAGHPDDAAFKSTVEALVNGTFDMEAAKAAARGR